MMKRKTKDWVIALLFWASFIFVLLGVTYLIGGYIQGRIIESYKMGITITPNPEYSMIVYYSDDAIEGVINFSFKPRFFSPGRMKIVKGYYTAPKKMHLWYWILMYGDKEVYRETIDLDVKAGDDIQFIYGVD